MPLQDNALLTVAELRAALAIQGTEQDAALEGFINGVSDACETLTGRRLKQRAYTAETLRVDRAWVLGIEWLDVEYPITALTALTVDGTVQTLWMPGDPGSPDAKDVYVLGARDPKHGPDRLFRPAGWPSGALVTRSYTAGYVDVPGDLKQAVTTLAVDWYYRRSRQADPVISRSAGAETITYVNEALPRTFPTQLGAYRRWR